MIIAIVPAPGHEALVADGPFYERPACLYRWRWRDEASDTWALPDPNDDPPSWNYERALILYAPGDPKLGMLRAMEAAFGVDAEAAVVRWDGEHEGWLADRDGDTLCDWPVVGPPPEMPALALPAFGLAHLLAQRGIAAEVIVIEPADKAKE